MDDENIQNKENSNIQREQETREELSKKQVILYSLMIGVTITIAILAMIGVNIFALLIIIGIVVVYVYLDKDISGTSNIEEIKEDNET